MKYSWFYFDLVSPELTIVVVFYERPFFLSFDISLLDISIYRDGQKYHFGIPVPADQFQFSADPLHIYLDDNRLFKVEDCYQMEVHHPGIKMELEIRPEYPHWKSREINLFKSGDDRFDWRVYLPKGSVTGKIQLGKEKITCTGDGYIDYNEGNFLLNKHLQSWRWGRFHSATDSIIWGDLYFKGNRIFHPCILINADSTHIIESDKPVEINPDRLRFHENGYLRQFSITNRLHLDKIDFLISNIPEDQLLFRKMHEFLFYRLDEKRWGKPIASRLANVVYTRSVMDLQETTGSQYSGLMEHIQFK